jgi:predicted DNA-binding protein YlxM (UPF0122 family)
MKRTDIVALSRAAIERLISNKVGVVKGTSKQLELLAKHKKKKELVRDSIHKANARST